MNKVKVQTLGVPCGRAIDSFNADLPTAVLETLLRHRQIFREEISKMGEVMSNDLMQQLIDNTELAKSLDLAAMRLISNEEDRQAVFKLTMDHPAIYGMVQHYRAGDISWEDCLQKLVLLLAEENMDLSRKLLTAFQTTTAEVQI